MNLIPFIEQFSDFVSQVPGLSNYIESKGHPNDIRALIESYRADLKDKGALTPQLDLMLKILLEKWSFIEEHSPKGIFHVNPHLAVDDSCILEEFFKDTRDKVRGVSFEDAKNQPYIGIKEKIVRQQVDYSEIYEKYLDCDHPYICAQIACAYINAKQYDVGLVFLQKALVHVFAAPNIYWHNQLAVQGCVDALYELQYQLGPIGMDQLTEVLPGGRYFILRCLYLLLSRAIYMNGDGEGEFDGVHVPQSVISKINYYSLRADLVLHYRTDFVIIFGIGVNPDIQFMSDKAYANAVAEQYGLGIMTKSAYDDSLKMYRYGSLRPNDTGGYAEIEDATWDELIERGRIRSQAFANSLYEEYLQGKFVVSHSVLADVIGYLHDFVVDSTLSYNDFIERRNAAYQKAWASFQQDFTEDSTYAMLCARFKQSKSCATEIAEYLRENNIEYLYHFTDRRNLASIIKNKGLFSWKYCEENKILIPVPGGDGLSRKLDTRFNLEDYVRLSFCEDHPMVYRLKSSGCDLVLLKIKLDAAWSKDTLFSDMNAAASLHHHGPNYDDLLRVDMRAVKRRRIFRDDPDFPKHQAEVMVKTFIPIEYIVNIDSPISL